MSCWCYKCNKPIEPTEELTCPQCGEDYVEYEDSIAPSEPARPVLTINFGPGQTFRFDGGPAINIINQMFGRAPEDEQDTGDNPVHNWFQNIFRRFGTAFGNPNGEGGDGRTMGDYFLGTEEQLQALADRLMRLNQQSLGSPPTDRSFIDTLKPVPYTDGCCVEPTCSVCFDDFAEGKDVIILPCRHGFHRECIEPWLQMHSECPCCRAKLPST